MVWAIVAVAIAVLGLAAWAGTGRLGEMPGEVNDRPKGYIPDGEVDHVFLENMSLPTAATGYRQSQVDAVLTSHAAGRDIEPGTRFDVTRRGYDMQSVDAVIERIGMHSDRGADDLPLSEAVADVADADESSAGTEIPEHGEGPEHSL